MVNHMVNYQPEVLDRTFAALSDPTRRAIIERLAAGESSVTGLAAPFAMSLPAISKHLRVLEDAGLVTRERDGRVHRIGLAPGRLRDASEWIAHYRRFWEERLDSLARYLEQTESKEKESWPPPRDPASPSSSSTPSPRPPRKSSKHGPGRKP
jgi:DNA-binding transcriptional ArsR family regulator